MNQKAYSVLFCALLASTFVHELRAKGVAPVSSRKLGVFGERAASNQVCHLECQWPSVNSTTSFGITIEVIGNVLVVANISASAALLLDVSAQIVVVLNGTSGAGVAIDLQAQSGVYISGGLWVGGSASLETLIRVKLSGSLKAIWNISGAVHFSVASVSSIILSVINRVIIHLVIGISTQIQRDPKLGPQILLFIATRLVVVLNGPLAGALELLIAEGVISVAFDVAGLVVALEALSTLISSAGGISQLRAAGVTLELASILGANSGVIALSNLLLQLSVSESALAAIAVILNNSTTVLVLIGSLGGGVLVGITGAFVLAGKIGLLVSKNVTLEEVLSSVITYVATSSVTVRSNLTEALSVSISGLVTVVEQINATASLSGFVSIVNSLQSGTLVIGGINISAILRRLVAVYIGASALLAVVAAVALELVIVSRSVVVTTLLLVLVSKLAVAAGILELIQLGIQIKLNILTTFATIIAASILLLPSLVLGGLYTVLIKLPTIGVIVTALSSALISLGIAVSLSALLTQSKALVLGFFQGVAGVSLGASSNSTAVGKAIFNSTSSISGYISGGLQISVSGSASGNASISG